MFRIYPLKNTSEKYKNAPPEKILVHCIVKNKRQNNKYFLNYFYANLNKKCTTLNVLI